ncbi:MAG: thioredoxin [Clostridia bacterium]|nr:thioredoxin [Clostridia bacterium]
MQVITSENVKEFLSEKVAVLDFWATWCGPCRMMSPIVEELAAKYQGKAAFGSVNVDEEEPLAISYGISVIPTLMFFKDGQMVKKTLGLHSSSELEGILDELLQA